MLQVGLTGGIACGKTTVSQRFSAHGIPVIDADEVARDVVVRGSKGLSKIVEQFGNDILAADATLDRKKLRQQIFSNTHAKKKLEDILHPLIRARMADIVSELPDTTHYCIKVIPLLFETKQEHTVDSIVVVDCPVSFQIDRIVARDNCSSTEAQNIIDSQVSRQKRLSGSNEVIVNDGDLDSLYQQVDNVHKRLVQWAASTHPTAT